MAVKDYPAGSAQTRSYGFTTIGNARYPASLSAPCALCGNTQAAWSYDAAGRLGKSIGHDGKPTFYAYDAKARESERAAYAASYAGAATRPALSLAESVTSTVWHATWKLPLQIAEPSKYREVGYDASANVVLDSVVDTTDATGAQKFAAARTDSTRAKRYWTYNTLSLAITIRQTLGERANGKGGKETGRWTYNYNALGSATHITDASGKINSVSAFDAHGRATGATSSVGPTAIASVFDPRGRLVEHRVGTEFATWRYGPTGELIAVTSSNGLDGTLTYSSLGALETFVANGVSVYPRALSAGPSGSTSDTASVSAAAPASTSAASNTWAVTEAGATANVLVGGASLNTGALVNLRTGESCPYVSICFRIAVGLQGSVGGKLGVQIGPHCGKDFNKEGWQVAAVGDAVTPAGGAGASVGVGYRTLTGLSVGAGPGWGLGFSAGLEFCSMHVATRACKNTPCDCK